MLGIVFGPLHILKTALILSVLDGAISGKHVLPVLSVKTSLIPGLYAKGYEV